MRVEHGASKRESGPGPLRNCGSDCDLDILDISYVHILKLQLECLCGEFHIPATRIDHFMAAK